jgi:hypothetical protein
MCHVGGACCLRSRPLDGPVGLRLRYGMRGVVRADAALAVSVSGR